VFVMAGLEFVDTTGDNLFAADDITRHMVTVPSALHEVLHL
jgi:hypothetical protein